VSNFFKKRWDVPSIISNDREKRYHIGRLFLTLWHRNVEKILNWLQNDVEYRRRLEYNERIESVQYMYLLMLKNE